MSVVELGVPNLRDMPANLRNLAEDIASGLIEAKSCTIVVRQDEDVLVLAYGDIDSVRAFMDLHAGARKLLR